MAEKFSINDDTEREIYNKAVQGAKGLGYKGLIAEGTKAVMGYREGLNKSVDQGIKDGTLRDKIKERTKKID